MCVYPGYDNSSVVDTIGVFDFRIVSICGITSLREDAVQSMTTSGFADFNARAASPETLTPILFGRPTTSPRSRPILAGSMSMPPTILNPGRYAICLAMAAPIGPSPKCTTRMFGISLELYGNRPCWRTDARPRRVGVPSAARSRSRKRRCDWAEAGGIARHTRAAPPPDDVGRVPGQEPRLRAHERPDGDHQRARRPWKRASLCRPVRSCDRSAYRARPL